MTFPQRLHDERGSIAVEVAVIAPALVFLMLLVVYAGKVSEADGNVERAASDAARAASLRQDPGAGNSLGRVRIDMPNTDAVFMHDTPSRGLFQSDSRSLSSGCVRVADVSDFVTWLAGPRVVSALRTATGWLSSISTG